jgi:alkane 1-monooxygenase
MKTARLPGQPASIDARSTLAIWSRHLLCLVLPLTCLTFLLTGPHVWYLALPWLLVVVGSVWADMRSSSERRQPSPEMPEWPFDALLYLLVALQVVNLALFVRLAMTGGLWTMDALVGLLLVGINSGYSAIVVAHELIHRREAHLQLLGRLLMATVFYEHFYTEHIRGHHARVGTAEDPATARYGETSEQFLRRTVPAQFRSAWGLECKRLGDARMSLLDRRQLGNRVLHGLVFEWSVALCVFAFAGAAALALYVLQAAIAVRLLEAVNYVEHWGLARSGRRVTPRDSWDTDSRFTLYTLVGLSRHSDHHAYASRPYQQLRYFEESPKMPYGYFGTVALALFRDRLLRRMLTKELRRCGLGPFAPSVDAAVGQSRAA